MKVKISRVRAYPKWWYIRRNPENPDLGEWVRKWSGARRWVRIWIRDETKG